MVKAGMEQGVDLSDGRTIFVPLVWYPRLTYFFYVVLRHFLKNRLKNVGFCGIIMHHLLYDGSSP